MLMLNHKMSAQEALQFNFISLVYKKQEFEEKLWPKILGYSTLPVGSVKAIKELMKRFDLNKLEEANRAENEALAKRWQTEEAFSAIMNFMTRKSSKI